MTGRNPSETSFHSNKDASRRCPWMTLSWRFPDERSCLASFLALEGAEVIAGVKPANLFRIVNRRQSCGRNLFELWHRHGQQVMAATPFTVRVMRATQDALLVLLFDPDLLDRRLRSRGGQVMLRRCGYPQSPSFEATLEHLAARVSRSGIPHEIGLFLGYPRKDVEAFIGWRETPATCQRLWKIYGKPRRSLELAETYASCRAQIANMLIRDHDPHALLAGCPSLAA